MEVVVADRLKAPTELGTHGRRLWLKLVREANDAGFRWDAMELEQVFHACEIRDTIADLQEQMSGQSRLIPGSREQWVINPLITEIRLRRQLLSQTLARLKLPEQKQDGLNIIGANPHRAGANKRWRGAGA
jgi:hypothetical protein